MLIYPAMPIEISMQDALDFICDMPDVLLRNYYDWFIPVNSEKEILQNINQEYREEAKWIAHYLFIDRGIPKDIDEGLSEAKARISIKQIDICYQLSQHSKTCKETFPICEFNHLWLWIFFKLSSCREDLRNKGILDTNPTIVSKTNKGKYQTQSISKYALSDKTRVHQRKEPRNTKPRLEFQTVTPEEFDFQHNFHHFINTCAYRLARKNKEFRFNYWEPYLQSLASFNNLVGQNPNIQSSYLMPDGEIFTTGKRKKIPKGFGVKL
jgi:hypothetical protein